GGTVTPERAIYNEAGEVVADPSEQVRLLWMMLDSWRFQYKGRAYTDAEIAECLAALEAAQAENARLHKGIVNAHYHLAERLREADRPWLMRWLGGLLKGATADMAGESARQHYAALDGGQP